MACNCNKEDGTLSGICFGTCKSHIGFITGEAERDPLNGFAELILSQVEKRIERQMYQLKIEFQAEQIKLYKEAFLEGIKAGMVLKDEYY